MPIFEIADIDSLPPIKRAEILIEAHFKEEHESARRNHLREFLNAGYDILKTNRGLSFNAFKEQFNKKTDNKFSDLWLQSYEISMERLHVIPVEVSNKPLIKIAEFLIENHFKEKLSWGIKQMHLVKFLNAGYDILKTNRDISLNAYEDEFNKETDNKFSNLWLHSYEISMERLYIIPAEVSDKLHEFVQATTSFQFSGGPTLEGIKEIVEDDVPEDELTFIIDQYEGGHISAFNPGEIFRRLQQEYQHRLPSLKKWYQDYKKSQSLSLSAPKRKTG